MKNAPRTPVKEPVDSNMFLMRLHNTIGNSSWVATFQSTNQLLTQLRKEIQDHLETHGIHPTPKEEANQPVTDDQFRKMGAL